jgi:hypothetical protein
LPLVERVVRINRQAVVADVATIPVYIVSRLALVTIEAQRLQGAEAEAVPIAAVRWVVVSDGRRRDSPLLEAGGAQGLDLELMAGALFPAQQAVPFAPGQGLGGLAMAAGTKTLCAAGKVCCPPTFPVKSGTYRVEIA